MRRRGAEEAGAVFIKIALMDAKALLFVPAPQSNYDDSRPIERIFIQSPPQAVEEQVIEARLVKEISFDPDVWIIEIEDKGGRHFLDLAKS